jgi:hypothetical protein
MQVGSPAGGWKKISHAGLAGLRAGSWGWGGSRNVQRMVWVVSEQGHAGVSALKASRQERCGVLGLLMCSQAGGVAVKARRSVRRPNSSCYLVPLCDMKIPVYCVYIRQKGGDTISKQRRVKEGVW